MLIKLTMDNPNLRIDDLFDKKLHKSLVRCEERGQIKKKRMSWQGELREVSSVGTAQSSVLLAPPVLSRSSQTSEIENNATDEDSSRER